MTYNSKKVNITEQNFKFHCVRCGECCRVGYRVYIQKEDIKNWIETDQAEIIDYLKIDLKSISLKEFNRHQEEESSAIKEIRKNCINKAYDEKFNELINFIQRNHFYRGKEYTLLRYYTFLPNMRHNPILTPKTFEIVLEGLNKGLDYIINLDSKGFCPFLKLNLCSIHHFKPLACKRFPYKKNGTLRDGEYFLSICKGIVI